MTKKIPGKIKRLLYKNIDWKNEAYDGEVGTDLAEVDEAELVSSEIGRGFHAPVLDIDFNVEVVPSSTEGHFHLYFDKKMSWKQYEKLLKALAEAEIIEEGWLMAAQAHQMTGVRVPWLKKEPEAPEFEAF